MPRRLGMLVLLAATACGGSDTKTAAPPPTSSGARPNTPRAEIPAAIVALLPKDGIYIAGGGLTSAAWRVVVDIDANTIFAGTMDEGNTSSTGPMDHESTRELSPRNKNHLMQMAYAAWAEPPATTPPAPMADYDEVFLVVEGDQTFFLEGYGPIKQPLAQQAIIEVRAAAGL